MEVATQVKGHAAQKGLVETTPPSVMILCYYLSTGLRCSFLLPLFIPLFSLFFFFLYFFVVIGVLSLLCSQFFLLPFLFFFRFNVFLSFCLLFFSFFVSSYFSFSHCANLSISSPFPSFFLFSFAFILPLLHT